MGIKVVFEQGQVVKIIPEPKGSYYEVRNLINEATDIISDGIPYDLTNRDSIYSIRIPEYTNFHKNKNANSLGVTGYLDYVLRMHAGILWNNGEYDLSMVCLGKACKLMLYSTIEWQRKDYYRIVNCYIELGRFKKAKEWNDWIEKNTPSFEDMHKKSFDNAISSCAFLNTDLIETSGGNACCEICAKYRNRIFSLTGKDIRFPKLPKDFHTGCGIGISPFVYGASEPTFNSKHFILYSWRPFKDDRTEKEKEDYIKRVELINEQKKLEPDLGHIIYYWFKPKLPNDFPKSLSGFSRMRNANSPKYQKLMQKIEAAGYQIPQSLEDVARWDDENN